MPDEPEPTDPDPGTADPETPDPGTPDLDGIADRLYALRPDEFVPERDEAVARARESGDRELARAIGRLRRPTRAAWLANLLARHNPDQLEGLLGLASGLADAQRTLDGAALRTLSTQRHRLVAAVAHEAARLAAARHEAVGDGLLRDLQGILEAALTDPAIADEVRSGRLTRTVSYSGFGPPADPDAVPTPAAKSPPAPVPAAADEVDAEEDAEEQRRERARRAEALVAAEAEEATARDRRQADEDARDDAVEARDSVRGRVVELTAELEAARRDERTATAAAREAETALKASARAAEQAAAAAARARARLEES